jgi:hypothetical protein
MINKADKYKEEDKKRRVTISNYINIIRNLLT